MVERFQDNHGLPIVAVEMTALALIVEQAVSVAKVDFSGNAIHEDHPSLDGRILG
jgi:hypothetical protein